MQHGPWANQPGSRVLRSRINNPRHAGAHPHIAAQRRQHRKHQNQTLEGVLRLLCGRVPGRSRKAGNAAQRQDGRTPGNNSQAAVCCVLALTTRDTPGQTPTSQHTAAADKHPTSSPPSPINQYAAYSALARTSSSPAIRST